MKASLIHNSTLRIITKDRDKTEIQHDYNLMECSKNELLVKRLTFHKDNKTSFSSGFVLKQNGKLFYTGIPNDLKLISLSVIDDCYHLCSNCNNCSPRKCKKVLDGSYTLNKRKGLDIDEAIIQSNRIEKYPFILLGYESFGTIADCLFVKECTNFTKYSNKKSATTIQLMEHKLALAQYIFPDVTSRNDLIKHLMSRGIT